MKLDVGTDSELHVLIRVILVIKVMNGIAKQHFEGLFLIFGSSLHSKPEIDWFLNWNLKLAVGSKTLQNSTLSLW